MFRIFVFFLCLSIPAFAQESAFRSTDYPLPRFVTLGSDEVYVRTGPGRKYPVQWVFKKRGLPVEIILEYDNWRKIKDFDGDAGWVHKSLLSGRRGALVNTRNNISIHKKPSNNSQLLVKLEPKVLVSVSECTSQWCAVNASGYKGWLEQKHLWGVYDSEEFD